jgi:hypothetical protein
MQLGSVFLAINLLDESLMTGERNDQLVARRMAFPARPGRLYGSDHHQAPLVTVGSMFGLVALQVLLAPGEVGECLGPGTQAEMDMHLGQVEARGGLARRRFGIRGR